jgi:short-subunit dehydrogenase
MIRRAGSGMTTSGALERAGGAALARPAAVVTGASSGIGLALARGLAERGYELLMVAEDDTLDAAAAGIADEGSTAEALQADLRHEEEVDRLAQRITTLGERLDVVALNAGVGVSGAFVETSIEAELDMIRLNVTSVVRLAKRVLPQMVANGHGRLLLTASVASDMPAPYLAVYGATKAFVLSFAEALRHELKDTGVTVTALQPGPTDTNFFARAGMEGSTPVGRSDAKSDPADVAREALDALFDGADKVITGAKNRMENLLAQVTPEPAKAARHAKLTKPDR